MSLHLIIGNQRYSSWSLRAWLCLQLSGLPHTCEKRSLLDAYAHPGALQAVSPSGRVPVLQTPEGLVWDSLAIAEYLAEQAAGLWPTPARQRALARCACAEMHSGFFRLREQLRMDSRAVEVREISPEVATEVARIVEIWATLRAQADPGDFLLGAPGIVDAFYAPVAIRFHTYGVPLPDQAAAYVRTLYEWPFLRQWLAEAATEVEVL